MKLFDTKGGSNPAAAEEFIEALCSLVNCQEDFDVTLTCGDLQLKAYDNAQLITDLLRAVENYKEDIS